MTEFAKVFINFLTKILLLNFLVDQLGVDVAVVPQRVFVEIMGLFFTFGKHSPLY